MGSNPDTFKSLLQNMTSRSSDSSDISSYDSQVLLCDPTFLRFADTRQYRLPWRSPWVIRNQGLSFFHHCRNSREAFPRIKDFLVGLPEPLKYRKQLIGTNQRSYPALERDISAISKLQRSTGCLSRTPFRRNYDVAGNLNWNSSIKHKRERELRAYS